MEACLLAVFALQLNFEEEQAPCEVSIEPRACFINRVCRYPSTMDESQAIPGRAEPNIGR